MGRTLEQKDESVRDRRRVRDGNMGAMGKRLIIPTSVVKNKNYVYRWVNDESARISVALANDYDFADETGEEVDQRSANRHRVHAGTQKDGSPLFSYLMRKRREWHDKDKAEGQTAIDENMKQIQTDAETSRTKPADLNVKVS